MRSFQFFFQKSNLSVTRVSSQIISFSFDLVVAYFSSHESQAQLGLRVPLYCLLICKKVFCRDNLPVYQKIARAGSSLIIKSIKFEVVTAMFATKKKSN